VEKVFKILRKEEVSGKNRQLFEQMEHSFGKVPNLYNVLAYSANALEAYLKLEGSPTSLNSKEMEAVNLVVSEVNACIYCISAHTMMARNTGISEEQSMLIRAGSAPFDVKLDALVKLAKAITEQRGHIDAVLLQNFFDAGYTRGNLVDLLMLIGDRTISNLLHAVTKVSVDFPLAKKLA
jgi:AhpD family alkylhydroperoxidase